MPDKEETYGPEVPKKKYITSTWDWLKGELQEYVAPTKKIPTHPSPSSQRKKIGGKEAIDVTRELTED